MKKTSEISRADKKHSVAASCFFNQNGNNFITTLRTKTFGNQRAESPGRRLKICMEKMDKSGITAKENDLSRQASRTPGPKRCESARKSVKETIGKLHFQEQPTKQDLENLRLSFLQIEKDYQNQIDTLSAEVSQLKGPAIVLNVKTEGTENDMPLEERNVALMANQAVAEDKSLDVLAAKLKKLQVEYQKLRSVVQREVGMIDPETSACIGKFEEDIEQFTAENEEIRSRLEKLNAKREADTVEVEQLTKEQALLEEELKALTEKKSAIAQKNAELRETLEIQRKTPPRSALKQSQVVTVPQPAPASEVEKNYLQQVVIELEAKVHLLLKDNTRLNDLLLSYATTA